MKNSRPNAAARLLWAAASLLAGLTQTSTAAAGEKAGKLRDRIDVVCWHEREKGIVHAALMNKDNVPHSLLTGIKDGHCTKPDESWPKSFRPLELPARSVTLCDFKASAVGTFLIFQGEVDADYDDHRGDDPSYPHLVRAFWILSEPKRLERHIVKRGEILHLPWKAETKGEPSVTLCTVYRKALPWLEIEAAPNIKTLNSNHEEERNRCIEEFTRAFPKNAGSIRSEATLMFDNALKIIIPGDVTIPFRIDTSKLKETGCVHLEIGYAKNYINDLQLDLRERVRLSLLVYEPDMKIIEKKLE